MEFDIRFIKEKDITDLIILINDNFDILGKKENIIKNMNESNRFLGAFFNDKLVGNILIREAVDFVAGETSFHLDYVCTDKDYQNKGIATKLLQEVEKIALEENISVINLTSSYFRQAAHHLYEKLNYQKRDSALFIKKIK